MYCNSGSPDSCSLTAHVVFHVSSESTHVHAPSAVASRASEHTSGQGLVVSSLTDRAHSGNVQEGTSLPAVRPHVYPDAELGPWAGSDVAGVQVHDPGAECVGSGPSTAFPGSRLASWILSSRG